MRTRGVCLEPSLISREPEGSGDSRQRVAGGRCGCCEVESMTRAGWCTPQLSRKLVLRSSGKVEVGLRVVRRILSPQYTPTHAPVASWGDLRCGVVFPVEVSERSLYEFPPIVDPDANLFEKELVVHAFVPRNRLKASATSGFCRTKFTHANQVRSSCTIFVNRNHPHSTLHSQADLDYIVLFRIVLR